MLLSHFFCSWFFAYFLRESLPLNQILFFITWPFHAQPLHNVTLMLLYLVVKSSRKASPPTTWFGTPHLMMHLAQNDVMTAGRVPLAASYILLYWCGTSEEAVYNGYSPKLQKATLVPLLKKLHFYLWKNGISGHGILWAINVRVRASWWKFMTKKTLTRHTNVSLDTKLSFVCRPFVSAVSGIFHREHFVLWGLELNRERRLGAKPQCCC